MSSNTSFVRHVKSKSILFVALGIVFLFWEYNQMRKTSIRFFDQYGTEHSLSLTVRDKKRLFHFMRTLFAEDNFAYTLLGHKPVSWACYKKPFPFVDFSMFRDSLKKYHRNLRVGWKTWSKYRHLFPSTSFWAETPKYHPGRVSILIVNEERFNHVVNKNKQDFQDVLNREIVDGLQLLREAENRSLMNEVLEGHQALMGIVLGYGRDNSWEFLKRSEKRDPLGCVWDEMNDQRSGGVRIRIGATDIESCLSLESCPSFAGNPNSEESLILKRDYLLTKQKVIDYYKDKDFLEATLSLLAGFRPAELSH